MGVRESSWNVPELLAVSIVEEKVNGAGFVLVDSAFGAFSH